jgi:hypothetical protein
MRSNPKFQNICSVRYGMYQKDKCVNCVKAAECDQHYDPASGEWDYKDPLTLEQERKAQIVCKIKNKKSSGKGPARPTLRKYNHARYLIRIGQIPPVKIETTLAEALEAAHL